MGDKRPESEASAKALYDVQEKIRRLMSAQRSESNFDFDCVLLCCLDSLSRNPRLPLELWQFAYSKRSQASFGPESEIQVEACCKYMPSPMGLQTDARVAS